ncbi:hypothetical protein [Anaeromassilibacillus sp. SJQ-1]|uniref:hypothetical protein n=1 Tax=Anaeromassilibacillus sp. SJQ-1 TaxID=3375419 RepID=UPI003988D065
MLALEHKADLTLLNVVIEKALDVLDDLNAGYYIPNEEANEAFKISLATAQSLTEESGQKTVDDAALDLSNKMAALRLKADKTALEELLKEMRGIDPSDYTPESYAPFAAVMKRAELMFNDPMLSVDDEPEIQSTVNEARALYTKLVRNHSGGNSSGSSSGGSHSSNSGNTSGMGTSVVTTNPIITAAQNVQTQIYVVSDTTLPFAVKRGSAYCFKMTVVGKHDSHAELHSRQWRCAEDAVCRKSRQRLLLPCVGDRRSGQQYGCVHHSARTESATALCGNRKIRAVSSANFLPMVVKKKTKIVLL